MAQQNKELLGRIDALSKQKNYPVKTDGLNNDQLQDVLRELEQAPGSTTTAAGGATRRSASQPSDERLPEGNGSESTVVLDTVGDRPPHGGIRANASTDVQRAMREGREAQREGADRTLAFAVAPGKSIVTARRGIVDGGGEIRADDVGGQQRLDALVERGTVVRDYSPAQAQQRAAGAVQTATGGTRQVLPAGAPGTPPTTPGEGGNR